MIEETENSSNDNEQMLEALNETQPDAASETPLEPSAAAGYQISLPMFEGPLDLLLHLIKQHKLNIYDIPILLITEQYNSYLDAMTELDLEIAADYIYIAALLIHIKSKMLLPRDEDSETPQEDPRAELVDRLLEYQRFKSVAETFAEVDVVRMGVWARPPSAGPEQEDKPVEVDMSDVSLFDLLEAFRSAYQRYKHAHPQSIELKRSVHKVSDKMRELMHDVTEKGEVRLLWYLEGRDRGELVAIFLAVLELVRLGGVGLAQSENFGDIAVKKSDKEIDAAQFALYDN
jgi:segregation and condensation protein A